MERRRCPRAKGALEAEEEPSPSMMAAQFRADTLERARMATEEAEGRASFKKFMGERKAYTPLN